MTTTYDKILKELKETKAILKAASDATGDIGNRKTHYGYAKSEGEDDDEDLGKGGPGSGRTKTGSEADWKRQGEDSVYSDKPRKKHPPPPVSWKKEPPASDKKIKEILGKSDEFTKEDHNKLGEILKELKSTTEMLKGGPGSGKPGHKTVHTARIGDTDVEYREKYGPKGRATEQVAAQTEGGANPIFRRVKHTRGKTNVGGDVPIF